MIIFFCMLVIFFFCERNLLMNSLLALVLFDSSASQSFVSRYFSRGFDMTLGDLECLLWVSITSEHKVSTLNIFSHYILEIFGVLYPIDPIPIHIGDVCVIVMMAWLSRSIVRGIMLWFVPQAGESSPFMARVPRLVQCFVRPQGLDNTSNIGAHVILHIWLIHEIFWSPVRKPRSSQFPIC